jgi:translation elongation factor EF-4|tara:strand:+ start:3204 stop:3323 length:120 start_codon:yes stop_codon:yes gene_type:complete
VTHKQKLLTKQAKGKKRMKRVGSAEIPHPELIGVHRAER